MEHRSSTIPDQADLELLDLCRRGDRRAMHTLYEQYQRRVFSIAFSFFGGDQERAEDVTQQVFVKLLSRMDFRGESQFTTWLYRMTVNQCCDEARKVKRWLGLTDWLQSAEPVVTQMSLTDRIYETEISGAVRSVIAGLKPKYRMPVILKYVEELSYQEIAEVLGISPGTVASRLNRGHKLLAQKLSHLRGELQ